jgi:hypothetical protein
MNAERVFKGWVPMLGVPTLFCVAFALWYFPPLVELPLCGVKLMIGIPCPGCGLVHSFVALFHGHLGESISFNPMGVIIAGALAYAFIRSMARIAGRPFKPLLSESPRRLVLNVFVTALIVQWVIGLILR